MCTNNLECVNDFVAYCVMMQIANTSAILLLVHQKFQNNTEQVGKYITILQIYRMYKSREIGGPVRVTLAWKRYIWGNKILNNDKQWCGKQWLRQPMGCRSIFQLTKHLDIFDVRNRHVKKNDESLASSYREHPDK